MHHTLRSARPAAVLALALAAALVAPGTAFAGTTAPTPVTTTPGSSTSTTSTASSGTSTGTESNTSSTTGTDTTTGTTTPSGTTTTTPSGTTTTTPSGTTTTTPSGTTTTTASEQARGLAKAALAAAAVPESQAAADFVASTLAAGGDHYVYPGSTFFDGGNTIDAILGLDGVGTHLAQADASTSYLDANLGSYIGTDFGSMYAGPTAKALLAAVAQGADPHHFGGLDLVAELQDAEGAIVPGRFSDLPVDCGFPPCDYSNTIGQSLALIALARAGEPLTATSVDFLLDQQCPDGGFRGALDGAGCLTDPDATAFAAQALVASADALLCGTGAATLPTRLAAALDAALDRLEALQAPSGALSSSDGTPNANTTGVAAQAFYAGGRTAPGDAAAGFLVTLQVDQTAPAAVRGGIAFTAADRVVLQTAPVTPDEQTAFTNASDRQLRATSQATLALAGGSLVDVAADGVVDAPAASACPAPPVTTTTTTTTTTTRPAGAVSTTPAVADPASAAPGELALTGSNVAALGLLGVLLLLAGVGAMVLARRKGVHA